MRGLTLAMAAVLMLAGPAAARCVVAGDLARGVVFARDGAFQGRLVAKDGGVFIDYATDSGSTDTRQTLFGIYELATVTAAGAEWVGTGPVAVRQVFRGDPPEPVAGQTWQVRIKATVTGDGTTGPDSGSTKVVRRQASYDFLPEKTVTISGCRYRVIPVEAHFRQSAAGFDQRWLYFADLGFGIETIPAGRTVSAGITALGPQD